MNEKQKKFHQNGYLKLENEVNFELIKNIRKDCFTKKIGTLYKDNEGKPRRLENIYDKTKNLKLLNNHLIKLIKKIFKKKMVIFKDKCNLKPPGGGGFRPHYDGIFYFKNENKKLKKGWYEYSNYFLNVLVALDKCTKQNGSIEIGRWHNKNFDSLYENTKKNGSPELKIKFAKKIKFKLIELNAGDILFFSNKCPHQSKKNLSKSSRKVLYYTYAIGKKNIYKRYFLDKQKSLNKNSKSLPG